MFYPLTTASLHCFDKHVLKQDSRRTQKLRLRRLGRRIREALHCLGQLRVYFVRDNHDVRQQQADIQHGEILMQCSKDGHLKDS